MEQLQKIVAEVMINPKLNKDAELLVTRYVRRVILQIKAHCNREDLPEALEEVAIQITEDMLIADGVIKTEKEISSISRGDTSISYKDSASTYHNAVRFMKDYDCQLVHFKRMKLPSDPND